MTLGQRVKQRREAKGWNKEELARRAGFHASLLTRIESGQVPDPGARVLKGLARALGCSIDYLVDLYGDDHAVPSSLATSTA